MNLTSGLVRAEITGSIGWLIWDNQSKLNALSPGMYEDALEVVQAFEANDAIKVVVMRGAGRRAFISGADISSFGKTRSSPEALKAAQVAPTTLRRKLIDLDKPLIAMIYGYCLGGGMGMALNADMRFASTDSQFGVPAAQRGVAYAPDGLKQLVDVVGPSSAKDIMFSARRLKSEEALRIGLINRVVDAEELEKETIAYAEVLASNAPLSMQASKYFINQLGLEHAERNEARMEAMQREAAASEDFKEATRSFMEKRRPVFTGR
jgi:enoyl-CoA hydratase